MFSTPANLQEVPPPPTRPRFLSISPYSLTNNNSTNNADTTNTTNTHTNRNNDTADARPHQGSLDAKTRQRIEKLAEYVSKNGKEFERLALERNEREFWFLNQCSDDRCCAEYLYYQRRLNDENNKVVEVGGVGSSAKIPTTTPTTDEEEREEQFLLQQRTIAEAKLRAKKLIEKQQRNTTTNDMEYAEDSSSILDVVGNLPNICRAANRCFQSGTYNAIDYVQVPKNVNDELLKKKSNNLEKYYEKRMRLFEEDVSKINSDNSNIAKQNDTTNNNIEEIEELNEIRRMRKNDSSSRRKDDDDGNEAFIAVSRGGAKLGLGLVEQSERNGDVQFLKFRNRQSKTYHHQSK